MKCGRNNISSFLIIKYYKKIEKDSNVCYNLNCDGALAKWLRRGSATP